MFEVLAEPHRRRILDLLRVEERPVGDLVADLGISQPAVSKHLRVLRDAGLVDVRADAQRRLYRLRPEPLREIDEWLTHTAPPGATASTHSRSTSTTWLRTTRRRRRHEKRTEKRGQ